MPEKSTGCQKPGQLKTEPHECSLEQIAICHGAQQAHPCLTDEDEKILAEFEKNVGFLPGPLLVMSKRPGLLSDFMAYADRLLEGGPLDDRERFLIALAVATALKSPNCIRTNSKRAQKAGATEDEVIQTILIAGLLSNTSPLHVAYDSAGIFDESEARL